MPVPENDGMSKWERILYELDWKRRVLVARITRQSINCGTMPPGYYP